MADIHPRRNKKGELISFGIRVYHGYDRFGNRIKPSCTTFKANPEWSEKKNRTECEKFANRFEEQCKMGFNLTHGITFSEYADYVIRLKERYRRKLWICLRNTRNGTMSKHKSGAVCGKIPGLYSYRRTAPLWTRQVLPTTAVRSRRNTDFHISTHTRSGT